MESTITEENGKGLVFYSGLWVIYGNWDPFGDLVLFPISIHHLGNIDCSSHE